MRIKHENGNVSGYKIALINSKTHQSTKHNQVHGGITENIHMKIRQASGIITNVYEFMC